MTSKQDLEEIAELRERLLAQGRSVPQIVEAIVAGFEVSWLKAHRLARGWTRRKAVDQILATYEADGLRAPRLAVQRLCAWEHDPRIRPGEDYLDRLCRAYETRADLLGYGRDYTPIAEPAAYAGAPVASLPVVSAGEDGNACEMQADGEEDTANRTEFLGALGATGLVEVLDRASDGAVRLGRKLGSSNLGPATLEQLELQVAGFAQRWDHTLMGELFHAVFAQQEKVEALLDGVQPLRQRRGLYRIAGQLSYLLGDLSRDLGDITAARTHLFTAEQLAWEVGDDALLAWVRVEQSTVALWAGDFRGALDYAQDGQRCASAGQQARLAVRCEGRAFARMRDRAGVRDALRRAERAMPSQPASEESDGWYPVFTLGDLELYTGMSLLWLGSPVDAEPHAREAIAWYQSAPLAFQSLSTQAQAQINLAICLVGQDQPDEGIRLVTEALGVDRARTGWNLQQVDEFLAALKPAHRDLPAARDLAERLQIMRAARPTPN